MSKTINILKYVILTLVIAWIQLLYLFFVDYFRARQSKDLLFCIKEETKNYPDGTVSSCTSLGYKMYRYNRTSVNRTIEFGPFFIKEKTK